MRNALVFFAKFAVAAPVFTVLFWLVAPGYLTLLGHVIAAILNTAFDAGVEAVTVTAQGILNTGTELAFTLDGRTAPIQLVGLVMGIPAFIALTVASPWPGARRFALVTLLGCAILVAAQVVYVVLVFRFSEAMQRSPQIPYMIVMLPFLLWLVLSYWRQIAAFFDDPPPQAPAESQRDQDG